jgi:hypothetical protein
MNTKNFIRGMGSVFDICPSDNNRNQIVKSPSTSDAEAFNKDLQAIGQDFKYAIGYIDGEDQQNKKSK